jgi:acetyltransferase-like isoleucine patch superfamily enzyme
MGASSQKGQGTVASTPFSGAKNNVRKEYDALRSRLFRARLLASCWWSGGGMTLGPGARVNHRTIFQGAGTLRIGACVTLGYPLSGFLGSPIIFQPRSAIAEIAIGEGSAIMNGCCLCAMEAIRIGALCRIGGNCYIVDSDFHGLHPDERDTPGLTAPVVIGDNVWFGVSVAVLKGVTIGRDAVVGAHAVVAKSVPDGAIVVGNPMRIVGSVYDRPRTAAGDSPL